MFVSSCFVSGFLISALGLYLGQYWVVVVGYGYGLHQLVIKIPALFGH